MLCYEVVVGVVVESVREGEGGGKLAGIAIRSKKKVARKSYVISWWMNILFDKKKRRWKDEWKKEANN